VEQLTPDSETIPTQIAATARRPLKSFTRSQLSASVLVILAATGVLACALIAAPLLPALTWALSLAVVAHPLHKWIADRLNGRHADIAAGIAVAIITTGLVAPAVFIGHQVVVQVEQGSKDFEHQLRSGEIEATLKRIPQLSSIVEWVKNNFNTGQPFEEIKNILGQYFEKWLTGTVYGAVHILIALFILFYLFRDRLRAVNSLRSMLPLSDQESDDVLEQVRGMIHATIYGTFVVAVIQGTLGGLMFWILGMPAPLVWGTVMAGLSLVPTLGAFAICLPAALLLAAQGEWIKAVVLAAWGVFAVGSIDNILHPIIVGKQIRMHTIPVFIATLGGLVLLGAPGLVLGPVTFALTLALLQVLRRRTVRDRSAKAPT
jgi:predicted PurR-regulated permease PerM